MKKNYLFISESTLKIIAIILMTIDHIALFLLPSNSNLQIALRAIGRLSMPLFVFMVVEGVYHTKKFWNYFLRLFILAVIIDFIGALTNFGPGNVMMDLAMYTLIFYALKQKNLKSLLCLIPMAYLVLSDFDILILGVSFFNSDYGTYGLVLALSIFIARVVSMRLCQTQADAMQVDREYFINENFQPTFNVATAIAIFIASAIFYFIYRLDYTLPILPGTISLQSWSIFSALFILFYNGKRGYDKPWFKYGSYLYYPLHLVVIYLISLAL